LGKIIEGFVIPSQPLGIELEDKLDCIKPLSAEKVASELYKVHQLD
jgi:hypothetical protein